MLTDSQIERYSRQIILPEIGGRGQEALLSASVAIVGAHGCASAAAVYLAAAGVGRIGLLDPGCAHGGDAERTLLHTAAADLAALNPDCTIGPLASPLTPESAVEVARRHDVVIVTDACAPGAGAAVETTMRLSAACVTQRKPLVWGGIAGSVGWVTAIAGQTVCYRCLLAQLPRAPEPQEPSGWSCPVSAGFIGTVQATESLKMVLGMDSALAGRLLTYDWRDTGVQEVDLVKDPDCATCGSPRQPRWEATLL